MIKVSPSLLSADLANLAKEIEDLDKSGADMFHFDVIDGVFAPNITFGIPVLKAIKKYSKKPFDVHLMLKNPIKYAEEFKNAGADIITVHIEALKHKDRELSYLKSLGVKVGVALNPATNEDVLKYLLNYIDVILVMSVNPGFSGQVFIESQIEKIKNIKNMVKSYPIQIEVDGGINDKTAKKVIEAGADILVTGSYLFDSSKGREEIITNLKNL